MRGALNEYATVAEFYTYLYRLFRCYEIYCGAAAVLEKKKFDKKGIIVLSQVKSCVQVQNCFYEILKIVLNKAYG